jgi:chromosome segregation protein
MMRLDQVEIVGFKSFCDRQELTFKGGVTGIVGPNGCGKSNISDAISWVLGEQSAKSLRGGAMSDVIFAGTTARQPVGMAEVNLRLTGLNGRSPDGREECTISRRLYRNGESEYLMNGSACRLRDIHELFMDTGLGSKAYSFIEQGKIGQILSNKPTDRRALIEEAAGVTKYRARRRQTQLKLDATQANLLRVNDIVTEVEKQLDSLKRQASKARRRMVLAEEQLGLERIVYGRTFTKLQADADGLSERARVEVERAERIDATIAAAETELETGRQGVFEQEKALEIVRAEHAELTFKANKFETHSAYCRDQARDAVSRSQAAAQEAEDLKARLTPLTEGLQGHEADGIAFARQRAASEANLQGLEAQLEQAVTALRTVEAEMETARSTQLSALTRISALGSARSAAQERVERAQATLSKLRTERDEVTRERDRVESARLETAARREQGEARKTALEIELEAARQNRNAAETERADLGRELDALHRERDQLAGRRASLEELVATHGAFDAGVRALLDDRAASGVEGVLADAIEVAPEHEKAVEGFLGDALQALLVRDAQTAEAGVRRLAESGEGRASFFMLGRESGPSAAPARPTEERILGRLSDLYRIGLPGGDAIKASLVDALVVRSLEDALFLSRALDAPFVTLGGEVVRGAWVEGGRGGRGLLAPRREVKELKEREAGIDQQLHHLKTREGEAAARIEAALLAIKQTEDGIHDAEKGLLSLDHETAALEDEKVRALRKLQVIEVELKQADSERALGEVRIGEIDKELQAAEDERMQTAALLSNLGQRLVAARNHSEDKQAVSAEARTTLAGLVEKEAATLKMKERFAAEFADLESRIENALTRSRELEERAKALDLEGVEAEKSLQEALTQRHRVTAAVAMEEERLRGSRGGIEAREEGLKARRRERDAIKDALNEIEVSRARAASDLDHLGREAHAAIGQTAAQAAQALGEEDQARDLEAVRAELAEVKEKIERIGPVNPLAVQEAQENEERFVFMTSQRQDLLDSIRELEDAIRQIDTESRSRFEEAFHIVNANFQETFKQLFGGGSAGLALVDSEDILEAGIDIMAQPPGKKLQNVLLLSGGEKAMTAIALLFAIFKYKPSPFCILDEVDAPLDDANIGRFVKMLDTIRGDTQFIIITHSRKTMQIADNLYGVTMEEPGVSKLVSVKFN